jgi:uncharacterized protein
MLLIPFEVRLSSIHGLGVFATAPVRNGTIIWQFDPGIDQRHPVSWLKRQPEHVRRFVATHCVLSLDERHYLVLGDHSVFVNHSLSPNLAPDDDHKVHDEGVVVARRDIDPGEELTINYAEIDAADRDRETRGRPLFEPERPAIRP